MITAFSFLQPSSSIVLHLLAGHVIFPAVCLYQTGPHPLQRCTGLTAWRLWGCHSIYGCVLHLWGNKSDEKVSNYAWGKINYYSTFTSFNFVGNAPTVSRYYAVEQGKNMDAKRSNKMAALSDPNFFFSFLFRASFQIILLATITLQWFCLLCNLYEVQMIG